LFVTADVGHAGEDLYDAAEDQGNDQCPDSILFRDSAQLRNAQGEGSDRQSE
jgi:hypothetical protein